MLYAPILSEICAYPMHVTLSDAAKLLLSCIDSQRWLTTAANADRDPNNNVLAFAKMMKTKVAMPAHFMDDLEHGAVNGRGLFTDFAAVAQSTGTYTALVGFVANVCSLLSSQYTQIPKRWCTSATACPFKLSTQYLS